MRSLSRLLASLLLAGVFPGARAEPPLGYYREPAIHGETIVFAAEGDLWKVGLDGGRARRLTSHPGDEGRSSISPDGRTVAFVAEYEGPSELYTMPFDGGLPTRRTYGASGVSVAGWTPDGRVLFSTQSFATLPDWQLVLLDPDDGALERIPLAQAADGVFDDAGTTLYFTRLPFQGSHTKRYRGGTVEQLWRWADGADEAEPLTTDYAGTSKSPMYWRGRVYFVSDRDGTMNLWSMTVDGGGLRQHTTHVGWDVASPSLSDGTIVYQLGADLHAYRIEAARDAVIGIRLDTDLDQTRERWVDEPMEYVTAYHPSPDGKRVVLTARGRVFVAPQRQGRFVEVTRSAGVRYRDARFLPDGETLVALSDASGEVELWRLPANGIGEETRLTSDGDVLRWEVVPSPDGRYLAHHDKSQRLWIYDTERRTNRLIDENRVADFRQLAWSPDSRWLAYVAAADNMFSRIKIWGVASGTSRELTSDRFDSYEPVFSPDGDWLYFLSDRELSSIVGNPWGNYQPEPYLDKTTRICLVALRPGLRSPFAPPDELHDDVADEEQERDDDDDEDEKKGRKQAGGEREPVKIDFDGIERRVGFVPLPPGNYGSLALNDKHLFWLSRKAGESTSTLVGVKISRQPLEVETLVDDVRGFEPSGDGKKLLLRKDDKLYVIDAEPKKAELDKRDVDLAGWRLSIIPRDEWRQMFVEAWRLERDYFYDPGMHGVDWKAMLDKYRPLVDRVTTRAELSDLIARMVSELSALHIFVSGGDMRDGPDEIAPASLGAVLERDEPAGGYRVAHIYRSDPDKPQAASPLARPGVELGEGDVIDAVNGRGTLDVPDIGVLLRGQAGRQLLLGVRPAGGSKRREVIAVPMTVSEAADLRYHEWEYTRRLEVERKGEGRIGYLHLRAMGGGDYTSWAEGFYPVFDRQGLIIDVRHNRGGNIDSWIISRLLRKAWFHWSQRTGYAPSWNMQYAFRGHVVVLCNERTASDGEAFSEGVKRLDLGTVIGTRTWGGEIWLTGSNRLVDRGIATAAEFGVYGPEGEWLIEGHGVEPDIVVDNLPHATFNGEDAQLDAAIDWLEKRIAEQPVERWSPPAYPDKSAGDDGDPTRKE
ncbi:MAG TPA: S41 family peptidase [Candidatus Polarisedimenticolaceae bacterium]|nr:S41 family peptidase [Candidatus Polarisedimenticolaceae bacterium]